MRPEYSASAPAATSRRARAPISSTTAFTSTSSIDDDAHYRVGIRQVLEHGIRLVLPQILDRVVPGGDSDRAGSHCLAASDVGGRVADHVDRVARELVPE